MQSGTQKVVRSPLLRNIDDKSRLFVPRLIMEVKYGCISSHGIITYSEIAMRMKSVYQGLRYYLVMRFGNKTSETMERHGPGFDRIYLFEHKKLPMGVRYNSSTYKKGDWDDHMTSKALKDGLTRWWTILEKI